MIDWRAFKILWSAGFQFYGRSSDEMENGFDIVKPINKIYAELTENCRAL